MGEAKRRQHAEQLVANPHYLDNEAAGIWSLDVIYPDNIPDMIPQARHNPQMVQKLEILKQGMVDLHNRRATTLCLLCARNFGGHAVGAFVLLTAQVDQPTGGVVNAACTHCTEQADILLERVKQYYRDHLFGEEVRFLSSWPPAAPGRA
jgi:hypothetical protein